MGHVPPVAVLSLAFAAGAAWALVGAPLGLAPLAALLLTLQGRGTMELLMIDVGQRDAIAIRSPRGRWVLVDTGPAPQQGDAAGHPVVRALKSLGVRRLEALVLTHPDLDHIGGASAILKNFDVGAIYDPGLPAGKQAFVDVLSLAAERAVTWRAARVGDRIDLDGIDLRVLSPAEGLAVRRREQRLFGRH